MTATAESKLQVHLFQAMSQPDFYPHRVLRVAVSSTHISTVFLTGDVVYKVKKAVKYDFLDYLTLRRRKHYCREEIRLNRRLSSGVYLDVVPITWADGRYCLEGPGRTVEYAVKMRQLPEQSSLRQLLRRRKLPPNAIEALARRLHEFYASAARGPSIDPYGSIDAIRENCEDNFRILPKIARGRYDADQLQIIRAATRSFLLRRHAIFEDRIKAGRIRDCHGDLRCGHIYFADGIQVIDCIEFNDRFRYADIACDVAYLIMDLEYEGFAGAARQLLDAIVRFSDDPDGYILIDFYKCYRAMIKSKISFIAMQNIPAGDYLHKHLSREATKYLSLAYDYAIRFTRPTIWVIFGLPASGKSTIAEKLAGILHIDWLRSDRIRKQLFTIDPAKAATADFEKGIYSPGSTALTYGKMLLSAQQTVEKDRSVILDATFSRAHQRKEALQMARDTDANIVFIECVVSSKSIRSRLAKREHGSPVSDARIHHFDDMRRRFEQAADIPDELHLHIDTEKPLKECIQQILAHDHYLRLR